MTGRQCEATFETSDVIATCLLSPGHPGPHYDMDHSVRWVAADGLTDEEALNAYCLACLAAPGNPCRDPMFGHVTAAPHPVRFGIALTGMDLPRS